MKPTLFEVVIKAENQGEGEGLNQKANLQKMNVPFVTKKALEERLSELHKKKGNDASEACVAEDDKSDFSQACVSSVTSTNEWLCDSA